MVLPGLKNEGSLDPQWSHVNVEAGPASWRPGSSQRAGSSKSNKRPPSTFSSLAGLEESRPGSSFGKSASASQLRRGLAKLPPLPREPMTFEDLYGLAKQRAMKKSAESRKAMLKKPAPIDEADLVGSSSKLPIRRTSTSGSNGPKMIKLSSSRPSTTGQLESLKQDAKQIEEEALQAEWASSTLSSMKTVEKVSHASDLNEETSLDKFGDTQDRDAEESEQADRNMGQTASAKLGDKLKRQASMLAKAPGQAFRATRQEAVRASRNYIKAVRLLVSGQGQVSEKDHLKDFEPTGAPDFSAAVTRHQAEGFTKDEIERMRTAFRRFKTSEGQEIHRDDLKEALRHLGYMKANNPAIIEEMVSEISRFATIDWQEFVDFVEKFAAWEREQFRMKFEHFDTDRTGELSRNELRGLLIEMHISPLKATLEEALAVVDIDGSGQVDFDEFLHLMAVLRVTEGFTCAEVRTLRVIFDRVAYTPLIGTQKEVKTEKLDEALAHWFGPQASDLAKRLRKKLLKVEADEDDGGLTSQPSSPTLKRRDSSGAFDEDRDIQHAEGLHFSEFLVWARRLREEEIAEYRTEFQKYDTSGTGSLAEHDIGNVIKALGYMPLQKMVKEVLESCDLDDNGVVDFDEFVNLMAVFRSTDGFNKNEVMELAGVFKANSQTTPEGEQVSCLELLDILRSLGYVTKLETVRQYVKEVDFDNSNSLDFREFLRLMRLHREEELKEVQKTFLKFKDDGDDQVSHKHLLKALASLGYKSQEEVLQDALKELDLDNVETLDFDEFVDIVDHSRKSSCESRRKRAGFSDDEIKRFEKAFAVYDEDGNGDIEKDELTKLLNDLNIPMGTTDDQQHMLRKLDDARVAARRAGVEDELIGNMGDPAVTFYTLLHLVRMLNSADDRAEVETDKQIMEQTHFTPKEVSEFREVFSHWANQPSAVAGSIASPSQADGQVVHKRGGLIGQAEDDTVTFLSADGVKRIVRSLGLPLSAEQKATLDDKVKTNVDQQGRVGFTGFLMLMRWMLDSNFGGCGDMVAPDKRPSAIERRGSSDRRGSQDRRDSQAS